jgi:hypothetical protein
MNFNMGQQNIITEILNKTSQDSSIYRFISTAELDNWCTKNKICQTVKTYLLANSINNWTEIGPFSFDSVGKIISDSEVVVQMGTQLLFIIMSLTHLQRLYFTMRLSLRKMKSQHLLN